ncbi:hypothetical protein GCM10009000_063390 [Halobacterium noricense]
MDGEKVLEATMVIISGYMLWGTTTFSIDSAAQFPRLAASVVFTGSILLLVRNYLPASIRRMLVSDGGTFEASEELTEQQESTEQDLAMTEEGVSSVNRPLHDSVFTALSIVGYALLGYAIGLLWASPWFVIVYARWYRIDLLRTAILTVVAFAIAYSFMVVLNVSMATGAILTLGGASWLV